MPTRTIALAQPLRPQDRGLGHTEPKMSPPIARILHHLRSLELSPSMVGPRLYSEFCRMLLDRLELRVVARLPGPDDARPRPSSSTSTAVGAFRVACTSPLATPRSGLASTASTPSPSSAAYETTRPPRLWAWPR